MKHFSTRKSDRCYLVWPFRGLPLDTRSQGWKRASKTLSPFLSASKGAKSRRVYGPNTGPEKRHRSPCASCQCRTVTYHDYPGAKTLVHLLIPITIGITLGHSGGYARKKGLCACSLVSKKWEPVTWIDPSKLFLGVEVLNPNQHLPIKWASLAGLVKRYEWRVVVVLVAPTTAELCTARPVFAPIVAWTAVTLLAFDNRDFDPMAQTIGDIYRRKAKTYVSPTQCCQRCIRPILWGGGCRA